MTKMFEKLKKFKRILVTGPQRSGTRICAKMIAKDIGHRYIDEAEFNADDLDRFEKLFLRTNVVFHCPAISAWIEVYGQDSDTMVVFMNREISEIITSQNRIGWPFETLELAKYGRKKGVISQIKYEHWQNYQRKMIKNQIEIEYNDLKNHPLWLDKKSRKNFNWKQTK